MSDIVEGLKGYLETPLRVNQEEIPAFQIILARALLVLLSLRSIKDAENLSSQLLEGLRRNLTGESDKFRKLDKNALKRVFFGEIGNIPRAFQLVNDEEAKAVEVYLKSLLLFEKGPLETYFGKTFEVKTYGQWLSGPMGAWDDTSLRLASMAITTATYKWESFTMPLDERLSVPLLFAQAKRYYAEKGFKIFPINREGSSRPLVNADKENGFSAFSGDDDYEVFISKASLEYIVSVTFPQMVMSGKMPAEFE